MRNLKIRGRLFLGFGVVVALIIGMTVLNLIYSNRTSFAVAEMTRATDIVVRLKDALLSVRQGRVQAWAYVATGDPDAIKARDDAFALFNKQYAEVETHVVSPAGQQLVKDYGDAVVDFMAKAKRLDDLKSKDIAQTAPEFGTAITDIKVAAKHYADTNDKAAGFYDDLAKSLSAGAMGEMETADRLSLAMGLVAGIFGLIIALRIARGIALPIKMMTEAMAELASGKLDIAIPSVAAAGEIGEMAEALEVFKRNAAEARRLATRDAVETKAKADHAQRIEQDIGGFDAVARGALDLLTSAATTMQATARSLAAGANDASSRSTMVAAAAEEASANVQTVAAASEQMTSSIAEIARHVTRSSEIAGQAVREGAETRATISGLHDAAQKIGAVVRLINDIASQTNLLALNATIEAARAGDAGKGFAVVASEVKILATQTGKATEEIAAQINAMQGATESAVAAIERINTTIDRMAEISTTIASAMEEQGAATREISRNVQQAAEGTHEVTQNISGINQVVAETSAGSEQVLTAAVSLGTQAALLRTEVAGFLGKIRAA